MRLQGPVVDRVERVEVGHAARVGGMVTSRSKSLKSLTGRAMPCRCASDQSASEETYPPRWVCSSARAPSISRS